MPDTSKKKAEDYLNEPELALLERRMAALPPAQQKKPDVREFEARKIIGERIGPASFTVADILAELGDDGSALPPESTLSAHGVDESTEVVNP